MIAAPLYIAYRVLAGVVKLVSSAVVEQNGWNGTLLNKKKKPIMQDQIFR